MANLTGSYETADKAGTVVAYNVKASTTIQRGSLVAVEDSSGYLILAGDATGRTFAGVAYEPGNNSAGVSGAVGVRVKKSGSFIYDFSGSWSQAIVGKKCYAVDDHTVALAATTTNDLYVGDIVALVDGVKVRVRIDRAVG